MTRCDDIIKFFDMFAPEELAEEWDNTGLLVGNCENSVERIMICLDITDGAVGEAIDRKADMIITHHPVIFKGLKRLNEKEAKGKLLYLLVRSGINVFSAHTNLDYAPLGVNTRLAATLGIEAAEVMGRGPGKYGMLRQDMSMSDFVFHVKKSLGVPFIRVAGNAEHVVRKVAVFGGSFDDNLEAFANTGADVLVTGDLKYHTALDAAEAGLCIIDAGHFSTEKVVLPSVAEALGKSFPEVEVILYESESDPFNTY